MMTRVYTVDRRVIITDQNHFTSINIQFSRNIPYYFKNTKEARSPAVKRFKQK